MDMAHMFLVTLPLDMIRQGSLHMYQGFCLDMFLGNSLLSNAKYIILRNERRIYILILVAMLLLLLLLLVLMIMVMMIITVVVVVVVVVIMMMAIMVIKIMLLWS